MDKGGRVVPRPHTGLLGYEMSGSPYNWTIQFLARRNCVCVTYGVCSEARRLPRCSVLASTLSARYKLAVISFAAER